MNEHFSALSLLLCLNPISPAFSVRQARGGLRGLDAKNQGQHQPIEIKLCISHYIYKSIPHEKSKVDRSYNLGDMTSQNYPRKKGTSHIIRLFTPRKRV